MAVKRPSSASAHVRAYKRPASSRSAKETVVAKQAREVAEALRLHGPSCGIASVSTEGAAACLATCAAASLQTPAEQRHAYEVNSVEVVAEVVGAIEAAMVKAVEMASAEVDNFPQEKIAREAAVGDASAKLAELDTSLTNCNAALEAATAEQKSAEAAAKVVEASASGKASDLATAKVEKEKLEAGMRDCLEPLKQGVQAATRSKLLAALRALGSKHGLERSMMEAVRWAFANDPDARGPFDAVAIEQFEASCRKAAVELGAAVESAEAAAAEAERAKEAALLTMTDAANKRKDCAAACKDAKEARAQGRRDLDAKKKAVANLLLDLRQVADGLDAKKNELTGFREGPLAHFAELKDLRAPAEEPEPEAEVAANLPTENADTADGGAVAAVSQPAEAVAEDPEEQFKMFREAAATASEL
eukprot:TRINITY_DN4734_c0_g1_i2.p1 TRINITY_DN4734_c0_g1~~TRINITY_DN4734_c0_g1_i2.p1  ORF type:complete len:420 (+),score=131.01 TRINITY_DN4734_c0_g1_i2:269-1528(+)